MIQNTLNCPLHTQSHYKAFIAIICVSVHAWYLYIILPAWLCSSYIASNKQGHILQYIPKVPEAGKNSQQGLCLLSLINNMAM